MVKNGSLFWDLTSKMMDLNMILSIFNMELYLEIMVQWIGLREILHQTHGTWNPPMFFLEKTWFPVNIFPLTNVLTIVMFGFPDWWAVWHVLYTHTYIYVEISETKTGMRQPCMRKHIGYNRRQPTIWGVIHLVVGYWSCNLLTKGFTSKISKYVSKRSKSKPVISHMVCVRRWSISPSTLLATGSRKESST